MHTNASLHSRLHALFARSARGGLHFGEVVAALQALGVSAYGVDYRAGRAICYLPDDSTLDIALEGEPARIAEAFSAADLTAAIRLAQRGEVMYPQFKVLSQAAGCCAYTVWIEGRHVAYHGRRGETHVEHFPE